METEQIFRTEVKVTPAWDSETRARGKHCCDMFFLLHGSKATISFEVFTGWHLDPKDNWAGCASNVAYHAHSPVYPDDTLCEDCGWLNGKSCYSGSLCLTTEFFRTLVEKGSEGLWEEMECLYHKYFDKEPEWLVEPYEQMATAVKR
jgi:hypothetical protein